jgi:hypothetical protein
MLTYEHVLNDAAYFGKSFGACERFGPGRRAGKALRRRLCHPGRAPRCHNDYGGEEEPAKSRRGEVAPCHGVSPLHGEERGHGNDKHDGEDHQLSGHYAPRRT